MGDPSPARVRKPRSRRTARSPRSSTLAIKGKRREYTGPERFLIFRRPPGEGGEKRGEKKMGRALVFSFFQSKDYSRWKGERRRKRGEREGEKEITQYFLFLLLPR